MRVAPSVFQRVHKTDENIIADLKLGKQPTQVKNYRPIALLCHTYKLYKRFILNRIMLEIDKNLIKKQDSFRSGKCCTSQVLHLIQHIENGFKFRKKITRAVFVDLSAAYDTINLRKL